jgi:hypothetical protein
VSGERISHLWHGTISGPGLALREQCFRPLVHHGLHSVQRSSGLSALIDLCTEPTSGRTSRFGRRAGQLTLDCAQTEATNHLDRPGAQSNLG